jgi:quinol monooxygenase YgiN
MAMELTIFARFHAREEQEAAVEALLREQVPKVRVEPGCLSIEAYSSTRDPRLYFLQARWTGKAAFEAHAMLPNTDRFVEQMQALIDHPFEASTARRLA